MNDPPELHDADGNPEEEVGLAPPDASDPLLEAFKKDVDRTLLTANLRKNSEERSQWFLRGMQSFYELRRAGQRHRAAAQSHPR